MNETFRKVLDRLCSTDKETRNAIIYFHVHFLDSFLFVCLFFVCHHKICIFITSISYIDEVSNLRDRMLTNQKHELMKRSCPWKCMHINQIRAMQRIFLSNIKF